MNNFTLYEITPDGFNEFIERNEMIKQNIDLESFFIQRKPYTLEENGVTKIGHINIQGPLVANASEFQKKTGITVYSQIAEELQTALEQNVDYVLLHINSPGGQSIGSQEVAEMIMNYPKPVYAIVNGICASASYKLASSCTEIYSTISSEIGSIGAIIAFDSTKKLMENMGVKRNIITNDEAVFKSIGQDFGEITEEQYNKLKEKVNASAKRFQQFVKQNRPELSELTFNGDMFYSEDALKFGLIDAIL
jgi:protease-4